MGRSRRYRSKQLLLTYQPSSSKAPGQRAFSRRHACEGRLLLSNLRHVSADADGDEYYRSAPFGLSFILPKGTSFVPGSAKLSDSLFGDSLFGGPDSITPSGTGSCGNGTSYVHFDFEENDFDDPSVLDRVNLFVKLNLEIESEAHNALVLAGITPFEPQDPRITTTSKTETIRVGS